MFAIYANIHCCAGSSSWRSQEPVIGVMQQAVQSCAMGSGCVLLAWGIRCGGMSQGFAHCWQAYRAAALRHHPDKNKGDAEGAKAKFQAAKDARDLLSDAKARAALDALLGCANAVLPCASICPAGHPACLRTGDATSPDLHSECNELTCARAYLRTSYGSQWLLWIARLTCVTAVQGACGEGGQVCGAG